MPSHPEKKNNQPDTPTVTKNPTNSSAPTITQNYQPTQTIKSPLTLKQINQSDTPAETKNPTISSAPPIGPNHQPTQTMKPTSSTAQIPKLTHSSSQILKSTDKLSRNSSDTTKLKEDTIDQPVLCSSNITPTDVSSPQSNSTSQHEKSTLSCKICGKTYGTRGGLHKHTKKNHPEEQPTTGSINC